jgi:hypothetical protein
MDDELNRAKDDAQITGEEMTQKTQHAAHEAEKHSHGLVDNIMNLGPEAGHAVAEGSHDLARGIHDAVTGIFHHDHPAAPHVDQPTPAGIQSADAPGIPEEMAQKTQHAAHEAEKHSHGLVDNIMNLGPDAGHAVAEGSHDLARGIHDSVTGIFHHDHPTVPHVDQPAPSSTEPAVPPPVQEEGDNVV